MEELTGTPQAQQPTSAATAWLGGNYRTIRLAADVDAVRVVVRSGASIGRKEALTTAVRVVDRWFAVGDVILTGSASTSSSARRSPFSQVDWCRLKAGSIVNVGRSSPLLGHAGGGEQVEWVSGPGPEQVLAVR